MELPCQGARVEEKHRLLKNREAYQEDSQVTVAEHIKKIVVKLDVRNQFYILL